jgi:hypothetical protein
MPVKVKVNSKDIWLNPTTRWDSMELPSSKIQLTVDPNFYVGTLNLTGK